MSEQIEWVLELDIADGKADEVKALASEMSGATRADEPGALVYDWFFSGDGTSCHILERYADSDAVMTHLGNFGEKFAERFMALLTPTGFRVYGPASEPVRAALAGFGAQHYDRVAGFDQGTA